MYSRALAKRRVGDRSAAELEILRGVLGNEEMSGHAFFYFRDPAYADGKSQAEQTDFISKDFIDQEKLAALQEQIEAGTLKVRKMTAKERAKHPPRERPERGRGRRRP